MRSVKWGGSIKEKGVEGTYCNWSSMFELRKMFKNWSLDVYFHMGIDKYRFSTDINYIRSFPFQVKMCFLTVPQNSDTKSFKNV